MSGVVPDKWHRSLMDTDQDGKISTQDLLTVMTSFGYHHTEEEVDAFLDDLPVCLENDRNEIFLRLGEKIDHEEKGSEARTIRWTSAHNIAQD
eukprot:762550-Hanusia_phi.AAC.6